VFSPDCSTLSLALRHALSPIFQASKVAPRDPDLKKKLAECEKEVKRLKFEEALATPVRSRRLQQEQHGSSRSSMGAA
jgi:hypothetical protein